MINKAGLHLIQSFESCELHSYQCPAGKWTVGYGHTGDDVVSGMMIDEATADYLLENDLHKAEKILDYVNVPLNENEQAALVSLAYNCGVYAIAHSSLMALLNEGRYDEAGQQFGRWNKVNGVPSTGLTRRRSAERVLWDTPAMPEAA